MNETRYMISDTAKKVDVETHVLRYWEEELELSIRRTELGHRYYTEEDIRVFRNIKELKERGFQLKAIKVLLPELRKKEMKNLDNIISLEEKLNQRNAKSQGEITEDEASGNKYEPVKEEAINEPKPESLEESKPQFEITLKEEDAMADIKDNQDKLHQFEMIVQNIVKRTLEDNNEELESRLANLVVREFDSRIQLQEEREEERFRKLDETIRFHQKNRQLVAATKDRGMNRKRKWFKLF